jgi:hypothetical protein
MGQSTEEFSHPFFALVVEDRFDLRLIEPHALTLGARLNLHLMKRDMLQSYAAASATRTRDFTDGFFMLGFVLLFEFCNELTITRGKILMLLTAFFFFQQVT